MDLAVMPKKLLHPSPSSCRHHNTPAPTGIAKHFCKAVWECFRNPRKEGLRGECCYAHVNSQECQWGKQENIANPVLPHSLIIHIQTIKIIHEKINFDHMNGSVRKTWWFKICCALERSVKHMPENIHMRVRNLNIWAWFTSMSLKVQTLYLFYICWNLAEQELWAFYCCQTPRILDYVVVPLCAGDWIFMCSWMSVWKHKTHSSSVGKACLSYFSSFGNQPNNFNTMEVKMLCYLRQSQTHQFQLKFWMLNTLRNGLKKAPQESHFLILWAKFPQEEVRLSKCSFKNLARVGQMSVQYQMGLEVSFF